MSYKNCAGTEKQKIGDALRQEGSMLVTRLGLAAAFLVLCSGEMPAFAGKRDNSIRFATDQVLDNIDPYFNSLRMGFIVQQHVWDTLIYRDPRTGEYKGQLATAWKQIDDRTIEVELRKGVTFHNGAEFTADDVVYTLNFVAKPENKIVRQSSVNWIDHVDKVDPYTARIITKQPTPAAIALLASSIPIYPHEYHAKVGPGGMSEKPVGTGPFRVIEHARGKYIRMERNAEYFADSPKPKPKVDKFEIRFIPDQQTQIAEVLAGGVDMIWNIASDQAEQMRAVPNLQVVPGETERIAFLHLNGSERTPVAAMRDIRVRKAILHAIDREAMVKSLVGQEARVLHTLCFPSQFGCTEEGAPRYSYDPSTAKQLLAEAGLPNGFDIDLYAYRDRTQTEAIIGYLRAVGIRANLRFLQVVAAQRARREGNVALEHWTWGAAIQDLSAMTPVFFGGTPDDMNRDGEVVALLVRGDTSLDLGIRREAYAKALALIQERAYALPLYSLPTHYVATRDLVFTAYPDETPRFWEMYYK